MNRLAEIIAHKREELIRRKAERPLAALRGAASGRPAPPPFAAALRAAPLGLIAEIKRRSPSAGVIREPLDAAAVARAYRAGGAQAISVLMDEKYFGGGEADFRSVREAVPLPLLYKEFVVDPWQVWHAASLGASAALLIVAALERPALEELLAVCRTARLEALVEVHDEEDLRIAATSGAELIGINNRDLKTFRVSLETTLRLVGKVPAGATVVSESGIRSGEDARRLREAGVHAILVGEHLLREDDPASAIRNLMTAIL